MMKSKTFDCVEMKRAIQEKHAREYAGMTSEEVAEHIQRKLAASDSPVAKWFRESTSARVPPASFPRKRESSPLQM